MGLFKQEIRVGLIQPKNLIEKVTFPKINHNNVDLFVNPGSVCYIDSIEYVGRSKAYQLDAECFGQKGDEPVGFVVPNKNNETVSIKFFGGKYCLSLSTLKDIKATFSICGTANIKISDYRKLINKYGDTLSKEQLTEDIVNNYRDYLKNDIQSYASAYIKDDTTENDLKGALMSIAKDCMLNEGSAFSILRDMGLILDYRGMSLHLNTVGETDALVDKVFTTLNDKFLRDITEEEAKKEAELYRQHELDKIAAENTKTTNTNITKTINDGTTTTKQTKIKEPVTYCHKCGHRARKNDIYCSQCGTKIIR